MIGRRIGEERIGVHQGDVLDMLRAELFPSLDFEKWRAGRVFVPLPDIVKPEAPVYVWASVRGSRPRQHEDRYRAMRVEHIERPYFLDTPAPQFAPDPPRYDFRDVTLRLGAVPIRPLALIHFDAFDVSPTPCHGRRWRKHRAHRRGRGHR